MGAARRARRALLGIATGLALLEACSYAPDFADDRLVCGARGACPKGYSCASDNKCWKDGNLPDGSGGVGGSGTGGNPGSDGGLDPRLEPFVGTWRFTTGTLDGSCSDDPTPIHNTLTSNDFIGVSRGGVGLQLEFFCPTGWSMRLPVATNTAIATAGQTCTQRTTSNGITTTYNWGAISLTFTTTDGRNATTTGHLQGTFSASDGSSGTCENMFSGQLSKQ